MHEFTSRHVGALFRQWTSTGQHGAAEVAQGSKVQISCFYSDPPTRNLTRKSMKNLLDYLGNNEYQKDQLRLAFLKDQIDDGQEDRVLLAAPESVKAKKKAAKKQAKAPDLFDELRELAAHDPETMQLMLALKSRLSAR